MNSAHVRRFVSGVLRAVRKSHMDLSLVLTSDREIRRFNRKYLGHDRPTDVLAFNMDERKRFSRKPVLGDVMISVDRARVHAARYNNGLWDEVKLYIVHGILHLLGYDDHRPKDRVRMRRKESEILRLVRS